MPRAVRLALTGDAGWTPQRALAEIGHYGPDVRRMSHEADQALQPVAHKVLADRLSALQVAMTSGWSADKAMIWLSESCRLLGDLPADIALAAIDDAVKASDRGFLPTVGEIRASADPKLADRQRIARRLKAVVELQDGRPQAAPEEAVAYCDPEEARRIVEEFGLRRAEDVPTIRRNEGAPRVPTAEDYAQLLGVSVEEARMRMMGQ